jgi:DNA topoisomerase-1
MKARPSTTHVSSISRKKHGTGFSFYRGDEHIDDKDDIAYFRSLHIPPAWHDVEISALRDDKVLATGYDQAGRRQAIYHPDFRASQDQAKFERILRFGKALPAMRRRVERDLTRRSLPKEKVLACIVRLMDEAYFRVGNQQYAKDNGHYGITTLRSKHADITSTTVTFDFIGKSGQKNHKRIKDRQIARIIKQLDDLPGYEIFEYLDDDGQVRKVSSQDVNNYIKQYMGDEYSAKDFRTWGGTLLATAELTAAERTSNQHERKKIVTACVKNVARRLGNTPAVTRSSYIDPRVLTAFDQSDDLSRLRRTIEKITPRKYLKPEEQGVLRLLQTY